MPIARRFSHLLPTANWITYSRIIFWPLMVYYFYHELYLAGGIAFGIGMVLDIVDGRVARWQGGVLSPAEEAGMSWWQVMFFKGETNHGMFVDPLLDKIVNGTAILMLGLKFAWWPVVVAPILVDIFLQFGVRWLKKRYSIGNGAANAWGKAKTWGQSMAVATILIWQIWLPDFRWTGWGVSNLMLIVATWLGVMSVYRHLRPVPKPSGPGLATT